MARRNKRPNKGQREDVKETSNETGSAVSNEIATKDARSTNDPEWYARDPRLLMDGANIPYNVPFGGQIDAFGGARGPLAINENVSVSSSYIPKSIPGIVSLALKPSFGCNSEKTDPLNVCANAFYTYVRYVNSGRKNYDPADLMLYATTFGDLYSFIVWCQRLYQYAFMYSQRNYYIGKDLILANGVHPEDIVANLANFRYWINTVVNKISSFCVPADIYYFKRRVFLYGNYYIENPYGNIKDQLYQFVPDGFYSFGYDDNNVGKLKYKVIGSYGTGPGGRITFADIVRYFNDLMSNITGDEDFGIMSGDILKAYGIEKLIHLGQMSEDGGIAPVYDPYVLSQFKNASVINVYRNQEATYNDTLGNSHAFGDVEQTADGLLVALESYDVDGDYKSDWYMSSNKFLTVESPDPNVGDTIEATRLTVGMQKRLGRVVVSSGTEIVVGVKITYAPSNPLSANVRVVTNWSTQIVENDIISSPILDLICQFKYIPLIPCYKWSQPTSKTYSLTDFRVFGNLDNTTLITNDIAARLHEIALLSLFYVPGVAKLIS